MGQADPFVLTGHTRTALAMTRPHCWPLGLSLPATQHCHPSDRHQGWQAGEDQRMGLAAAVPGVSAIHGSVSRCTPKRHLGEGRRGEAS